MRKLFLTLVITLFLQSIMFAQASVIGGLGFGGGMNFGYIKTNLKDINSVITKANYPEIKEGIFGYGGSLNLLMDNYRFGYFAISGKKENTISVSGSNRTTKFEYGSFMGTIGYDFLSVEGFHFCFDVGLGAGYIDLDLIEKTPTPVLWDNFWGTLATQPKSTGYTSTKLTTTFFQYQPSLTIEYIYGSFFKLFVTGDYIGTLKPTWYINNDVELQNQPDMNINGFSVRFGIHIGIFIDN